MITGFNTDIEHEGVTYHVQTEDKGLETPLILSLVYTGGTILAGKRSFYNDLIDSGFDEKVLAERLQRQHRLICAAIRSGRIEDLKQMSQREAVARATEKAERKKEQAPVSITTPDLNINEQPVIVNEQPVIVIEQSVVVSEQPVIINQPEAQPVPQAAIPLSPLTPPLVPPFIAPVPPPYSPPLPPPTPRKKNQTPIIMRPAPLEEFELAGRGEAEAELILELAEDRDFFAGDVVALRIRVYRGVEDDRVADAPVTVKILGTTFRPLICSATTDRDGLAVIFTTLPRFTSGRAAILIRTSVGAQDAELRRIILPA